MRIHIFKKTIFVTIAALMSFSYSIELHSKTRGSNIDRFNPLIKDLQFGFKGFDCRLIQNQSFADFKIMTLCKSVAHALDTLEEAFIKSRRRSYMRLYDAILRSNYHVIGGDSIACGDHTSAFTRFNLINSIGNFDAKIQSNLDSLIEGIFFQREYNVYFCPLSIFPGGLQKPSEVVIHESGHALGFGECKSESLAIMAVVEAEVAGSESVAYAEKCGFGTTWESAVQAAKQYLVNTD